MSSIRHIVLVSQDEWRIEHYRREHDGTWRYSAHVAGDAVALDTLGVTFAVDEIYDGIDAFGGPTRSARRGGPCVGVAAIGAPVR